MKSPSARRVLITVLVLAFLGLQARLWFGNGSLRQVASLKKQVHSLKMQNKQLRDRNTLMEAEVSDLKSGLGAVEEIARKDLGMIRKGETFFLVVGDQGGNQDDASH